MLSQTGILSGALTPHARELMRAFHLLCSILDFGMQILLGYTFPKGVCTRMPLADFKFKVVCDT